MLEATRPALYVFAKIQYKDLAVRAVLLPRTTDELVLVSSHIGELDLGTYHLQGSNPQGFLSFFSLIYDYHRYPHILVMILTILTVRYDGHGSVSGFGGFVLLRNLCGRTIDRTIDTPTSDTKGS